MRVYADCYELMSEILREVWEMGQLVKTNSMQNKVIKGDDEFETKEIINYSYCLTSMVRPEFLFISDPSAKEWADAEFEERIKNPNTGSGELFKNPGEAWKLRGNIWKQFLNEVGRFDYTYNERIDPQIKLPLLIQELKSNPGSRQCVLAIWDRSDMYHLGGKRRIPCSLHYQFLIRDGKLHIVYNQRSADVVTHFGNDIYLALRLQRYIANKVSVDVGYLFHNITSLHAYRKDWPILKKSITEIRDARI